MFGCAFSGKSRIFLFHNRQYEVNCEKGGTFGMRTDLILRMTGMLMISRRRCLEVMESVEALFAFILSDISSHTQ